MDPPGECFVATQHCGLCLLRFPSRSFDNVDLWQFEFRAILCLDLGDEKTIELTRLAILPSLNNDVDVSLIGHPRRRTVTISRNKCLRQNDIRALCFHDWCYTILKSNLGDCSKALIYKLTRSLIPTRSRWENTYEGQNPGLSCRSLEPLSSSLKQHTHHSELVFASRLPAEIVSHIWQYVGLYTPYSAFIIVNGETSRLAKQLREPSHDNLSLVQGSKLFAKTIHVFGIEYIQELLQGGSDDEAANFKCEVLGVVNCLKIARGPNGICAIKVLGVDWETDWVGTIPRSACVWYGTIRGVKSGIHCRNNELNCNDMLAIEARSKNQVLWDHENFPTSPLDLNIALFDFDRDILQTHIEEPDRRFFRCLSLYDDGEYMKGLTVYLSGNGIIGLQVHFKTISRISGCRDGCALYFHFQPGERIAHTWLRILNTTSITFAAPALFIQTTLGRIYVFGSYIWPHLVMRDQYKWILLKKEGNVAGLYYENPIGQTIMRIGVTGDSAPSKTISLSPQFHNCEIPTRPFAAPNAGLFLSVASFVGVDEVDTCRVGDRYTGILIHYEGGLTTVLGQWHASEFSQHSRIYSTTWAPITHICFRTSPYKRHQIVSDINILTEGMHDMRDSSWQVFGMGQEIAWWFSQFYDTVIPWQGEVLRIPDSSRIKQPESS